ncbi:hypothetical protein M3D93_14820, partial [Dietzia cinnamea]
GCAPDPSPPRSPTTPHPDAPPLPTGRPQGRLMSYFSHIGLSKSLNVRFVTRARQQGVVRVDEAETV